jgi:hypothetical protein
MFARPSPRTLAVAALGVVGLILSIVWLVARDAPSGAAEPVVRPNPVTGPFEGLGVWVDIYDREAWADPVGAVETMVAAGATTLYLQTSNADRMGPFVFEDETAVFIEAAHDRGVQVVAWYLPHLSDLVVDKARTRAAITFTTLRGDRFDGFALDIESASVRVVERRNARLATLSERLRAVAGEDYPLGAIVPSPLRLADDASYWPGFPWSDLALTYDAVLPMTYSTYRVQGPAETIAYVSRAIDEIRTGVGSDEVPIHVIGGLARDSSLPETRAFVRAVRDAGVIGASYYTLPFVTQEQWGVLRRIGVGAGAV